MSVQSPNGRVVDLSLTLAEDLPCSWPDHVPFQHKVFAWFLDQSQPSAPQVRTGSFHSRWLLAAEHVATHFDAPTHCVPPPGSGIPGAHPAGAISADSVPLEQLMGPAAVIDVTHMAARGSPGESPLVEQAEIEDFERSHGRLDIGEVVLLRTGWDRHYRAGPEGAQYVSAPIGGLAPAWPAPAASAVEMLVDRGVRCIGTDAPTMGAAHDPLPAHVAALRRHVPLVEGLARLGELPPRGAWFIFLPLKLRDGSGAPGRAIALIDEETRH